MTAHAPLAALHDEHEDRRSWVASCHLLSEFTKTGQRGAQRGAGHLKDSFERPIEFQVKKIAPETDNTVTRKAATTVAFLGAKRPKLAKMMVSQKTKTNRNGKGMELPAVSKSSDRVRPKLMVC